MLKQKRFIADASHELRTPIAVVTTGIEVALNNKKLDFSSAKKTLEETLEEMIKFSKLSSTLLDITKYNTLAHTRHEPININELIKSITEKYKNLTMPKNISIETTVESPATVEGSDIEFTRVLYNILDNAVKYTPENGKIKITGETNQNKYVITVSDNGIGIPKNIMDKIFDPFFRGDTNRSTGGAGLGLTLVKKIVEDHKGTIFIKSEENKGTNVIITLPFYTSSS
jgi:signal transduction histidine kinase